MSATLRQRAPSPPAGQVEKDQLIREAEEKELSEGQKFVLPNYTVKQLLDVIPAHCFHRSALRSSVYVLQDVVVIGALVYAYFHIDSFLSRFNLPAAVFYAAKTILTFGYIVMTGFFGTGLWVIGHECGHQAYSGSKQVNNSVGWVIHSLLLVPYHSWRISHARHHAATNHLTRDEVFVPKTRKEYKAPPIKEEGEILGMTVSEFRQSELKEALEDSPIMICYNLFIRQVFGWPAYLIMNASGQRHYPKGTNHFTPSSIIFKPAQFLQIIASDIGVFATLAGLAYWSYARSFTEMMIVYFIPYLFVNNWLVMITFLQHTDPLLPHYSANKWTFARGALCTVDRKFFGWIGPVALHGIAETHVAHHISSKMPHYHAWEATEALKTFLGQHYHQSDEHILKSCYRIYKTCLFIEEGQDVAFFKDANGLAQKVGVEETGNVSDSGVDMGEAK